MFKNLYGVSSCVWEQMDTGRHVYLGLGIRKLRPFKCCEMSPICNTGSVPKTVTWYWHFVCTDIAFEPNFPHGGSFYKKMLLLMIFDRTS